VKAAMPDPRRVEEASLNAWPALDQLLLDGWVLRFARGFTKRANSVVPLYASRRPAAEKIRFCENLYARERLATIFRLTSLDDRGELDGLLAARGYRRADDTLVLARPLDAHAPESTGAALTFLAQADWLRCYLEIAESPPETAPLHAAVLKAIRMPCALAALADPHVAAQVACGLGVLENELLGLFDIATHRDHRRRGHGERLVAGLLHWGARAGAGTAYLQVLESNERALRLYQRLGFGTLYRYWYRIEPV
jgi:ribosomal protein S18 acetylase RimI-like enzyme